MYLYSVFCKLIEHCVSRREEESVWRGEGRKRVCLGRVKNRKYDGNALLIVDCCYTCMTP